MAEFYPCTIADLDGDGKKDILLPFRKYQYPITYAFSYLLRQDTVTTLENDETQVPNQFNLFQNYPNSFNPSTKIHFVIASGAKQSQFVTLKVYDVLGNEIATLVNEEKPAGEYDVEFNSHSGIVRNLPSGVYFYQLKAGGYSETKKMVLMK